MLPPRKGASSPEGRFVRRPGMGQKTVLARATMLNASSDPVRVRSGSAQGAVRVWPGSDRIGQRPVKVLASRLPISFGGPDTLQYGWSCVMPSFPSATVGGRSDPHDSPRAPLLVVSVHDVAPGSAAETERWCADADALGIPVSLLVIPGPWRGAQLMDHPDFAAMLRDRVVRGDELVLHGWCHRAGQEGGRVRRAAGYAVARGAAEFAALDERQAAERIGNAGRVLDTLGLSMAGFTPPGWLASGAAERALASAGFQYTTSHFG